MVKDKIWATRVKIAKQTLKMPDAIAAVMGGPTKAQARETLRLDAEKRKAKSAATRSAHRLYRVVARLPHGSNQRGHPVATKLTWVSREDAQKYADATNKVYPRAGAKVVVDNERVRKMIP